MILGSPSDDARPARATGETLRQHNLSLLARAVVLGSEPSARSDLAATTGLNRSTVTRLVDQLICRGILTERGTRQVGSGRPSVPLHAAAHTHTALGVEVSAEDVSVCLVDLSGQVIARHYREVDDPGDAATVLAQVAEACRRLADDARASGLHVVACHVGLPGLIDPTTARLLTAPNLGWRDINLPAALERGWPTSGIPTHFDNSATLAACAEWVARHRHRDELAQFIYVTGSSGVGSAVVREDRVEPGLRGWGGELGHTWMDASGGPCSCGADGCLETFVGRAGLMRRAGFHADAPWGVLLAALHRGDRSANEAVRHAGVLLGRALAAYVNLVDAPSVVVGGLLRQLFDALLPGIRAELDQRVLSAPWSPVAVSRGLVAEDAVATGGAWRGLLDYLDTPDRWVSPPPELLGYRSVSETPEVVIDDP